MSNGHDRRVVITGAGPVSAIGIGRQAFLQAMRTGQDGIGPAAGGGPAGVTSALAGEVRGFDVRDYLETEKPYLDRASQLAFAAMSLALEDADLDLRAMNRADIGLVLGSAYGCLESQALFFADFLEKGPRFVKPILFPHTYANTTISLLAIDYGLSGYHLAVASGATSSAAALLQAADLVRSGRCPVVLAGGVDALSPLRRRAGELTCRVSPRDGTGSERCAPFDLARNGCVPGEGAAVLVLESADHAAARGARILGEWAGGSTGADLSLHTGQGDGAELAALMERACAATGRPGCVLAAAGGARVADRIEARALVRFLGHAAAGIPVSAVKAMLGDTAGADAALRLVAALGVLDDARVPPTLHLCQPETAGLSYAMQQPAACGPGPVLVNAIDPGGSVVCLVVKKGAAQARGVAARIKG